MLRDLQYLLCYNTVSSHSANKSQLPTAASRMAEWFLNLKLPSCTYAGTYLQVHRYTHGPHKLCPTQVPPWKNASISREKSRRSLLLLLLPTFLYGFEYIDTWAKNNNWTEGQPKHFGAVLFPLYAYMYTGYICKAGLIAY